MPRKKVVTRFHLLADAIEHIAAADAALTSIDLRQGPASTRQALREARTATADARRRVEAAYKSEIAAFNESAQRRVQAMKLLQGNSSPARMPSAEARA